MNTNKVKKTKLKLLHFFPQTNSKRVMTIHYMNMMVKLSADESTLLNFLIKESTVYNTFKYSTRLMNKYQKYMAAVCLNDKPYIKTNIHHLRDNFILLIEKGLILRYKNEYVINYNLTFMPQYSSAVKRWINQYQAIEPTNIEFAVSAIEVINEQMLKEIRK